MIKKSTAIILMRCNKSLEKSMSGKEWILKIYSHKCIHGHNLTLLTQAGTITLLKNHQQIPGQAS